MRKYILVDPSTNLILGLGNHLPVIKLLKEGIENPVLRSIDPVHPFYKVANKTMMMNKNFVMQGRVIVESEEKFPVEIISKRKLFDLRESLALRLFLLVYNWIEENDPVLFGSANDIEFALRDCTVSKNEFSDDVDLYSEMLSIDSTVGYQRLDRIASESRSLKIKGLAYVHKYSTLINACQTDTDVERVNSLMYHEWSNYINLENPNE